MRGSAKRPKSAPISNDSYFKSMGKTEHILARPTSALPSLSCLMRRARHLLQRVVNQ
jgi:hypothetical protein